MEESILTSIKKLLGIEENYVHFDPDLIMTINTALSILTQLGVGPSTGFSIEDDSTTWDEYLSGDKRFEMVKSYIHLKVRLLFDPPQSSAMLGAIEKTLNELEWRILIQADASNK